MEGKYNQRHIVFCNCGGDRISTEAKQSVENILQNSGTKYTRINDLCGISALRKDKVSEIFNDGSDYLVIGCYRRTMDLLLRQSLSDMPGISEYVNLIEQSSDEVEEKIAAFSAGKFGSPESLEVTEDSGWPSWYPVIDQERCTNCGQCADFCLFGVFEKSGAHVNVVNPRGCKNNCPACARICPSAAIIFPKYIHGGAIGGSDEIDETAEQLRQAQDIESILGDDLYEALERRRARRKSIIREEVLAKAMAERNQALGVSIKN
jgi:Pyruvate/2-oxoacid:ferredoxin oxidoreductase delta subunit